MGLAQAVVREASAQQAGQEAVQLAEAWGGALSRLGAVKAPIGCE